MTTRTIKTTQSNHNMNAPWWWKRLESALLFLFAALIPLFGNSQTLPANMKHDVCTIYMPGLIILVKAVGIFFMGEPAQVIQIKDG